MRYLLLLGAALLTLAACASSKGADCDPAVEVCGDAPDAGPPAPDAMPLKGFGEPCTDRSECESNICILVGTSGICTETCTGDDCPEDFGCLGVMDSVEPGQVDYVCVPVSSQLCTPCTAHSECTLIGQDLCVANALGDSFCARDCSTITCPAGYSCDVVGVDGDDYEQCIPNSGFCDCVAENQGLTEACLIETPAPFSTQCAGTRTCLGDGGWGGCEPPSPSDDPDDAFTDSNCDGIDGDVTRGIFVGSAGANTPTCGTVVSAPCQTIAYGVVRAAQTSRPHVYVQTGTYSEVVPMVNGVSIYGGYDVTWQRASYSLAAHRVSVIGTLDNGIGGAGEYLVIRAHDLIVPVTVDNLLLEGPDASGAGKSSYAVHVDAAVITLTNVQILAGNGATGSTGSNGLNAFSIATAAGGGTGGAGAEELDCDGSSHGTGAGGGTNTCTSSPSSRLMNGGSGGNGGEMDTSCPFSLSATSGDPGTDASYAPGSFGQGSAGGPANSSGCNSGGGTPGGTGSPGLIANGAPGGGGSSGGTIVSGYWSGNNGGNGSTGENGSGGGGGGGGGGCDDGTDAYGAGGGGGGAGGCAARGGGGGGGGAGGSFGVFAVGNSTVTMMSCSIFRGLGGNGGTGGNGGRGQPGGAAGPGGAHPGASAAGSGGTGAHGGHGGGGGGGAGGRSVGIAWTPGTTVSYDCTFSGGAGGGGGAGGVSALAVQGTFEDDGFDGGSGVSGMLESVRMCATGSAC